MCCSYWGECRSHCVCVHGCNGGSYKTLMRIFPLCAPLNTTIIISDITHYTKGSRLHKMIKGIGYTARCIIQMHILATCVYWSLDRVHVHVYFHHCYIYNLLLRSALVCIIIIITIWEMATRFCALHEPSILHLLCMYPVHSVPFG